MKFAPMKKTIYSLGALREVLNAANRRYLEFLSAIDDPSNGIDKLHKITRTVHEERSYRGFNFFNQDDEALFLAPARGEFTISGSKIRRCALASHNTTAAKCPEFCAGFALMASSEKRANCYKYYLTVLGKQVVALGLKLKELIIIPELAAELPR